MGTTTGLRDGASFGRASRWVRLPVIGTVPLYRGAHLGVCWLRLAQPRASHASPSPSSPGSVTLVLDAGCASFAGGCRLLWSTAHGGCMRLSCAIGPTHLLHRPRRERLLWSTVLGVPPSPLGWLLWSTALAGAGLCFFGCPGLVVVLPCSSVRGCVWPATPVLFVSVHAWLRCHVAAHHAHIVPLAVSSAQCPSHFVYRGGLSGSAVVPSKLCAGGW